MNIRKHAVGTAFGILVLTSCAGSATAADWQALQGVSATPMTAAQMQSVQGKAMFSLDQAGSMNNQTYLAGVFGVNTPSTSGGIYSLSSAGDSQTTIVFSVGGGGR